MNVTKDIFALDYHFTRDFDRKHKNRFGLYLKPSGTELVGVIRLANGDRQELPPEPEKLAKHIGMKRMKAMSKVMEERAKEKYPEYFKEGVKISRTGIILIRKEYRGRGLAKKFPEMLK